MKTTFVPLLAPLLCWALAQTAVAQPPANPSGKEMVNRADTDGDGKVSRDEFIKARTAALEEAFARMDADGDGKLDPQEAEAAAERLRPMGPGGREGLRRPDRPRPQGPGSERPPRAADEGPQGPGGGPLGDQAFDRFDEDGDGQLSRAEFAAGMARMREFKERGGKGPGGLGRPDRGGGPAEGFRQPPKRD